MSNTVKLPTCPKCGIPIPQEAPQGLCPKCVLLAAATATEQGVPATATSEIPSIERIAEAFPQLEVLELIGRGGMGFVFKARQPHLDRFVALKLLPDKLAKDPQFAERFNREGRVLAKLNHPNIVSVFDFGQAGGFYYLSMEYVDGVNLRQAMRAGRFSPAEALSIVPKVCEALQYAHEQGILHRDIKPENILLDTKGRVKIADFGIAKLVGEDQPNITLTNTGAALGTPHYMAPEQLEKPATVDHRADIYSLGVVFYEMLTGELPIGRFAAPSSKTPVNTTVDDVVFRTLEKDRELRFQSAGEMRTQVEHLGLGATAVPLSAEAAKTPPAPTVVPAPAWVKRLGILFCVLGAVAFVPTLFGIANREAIFHSHVLLALTGAALLIRTPSLLGLALLPTSLPLIAPVVFLIMHAFGAGDGSVPARMFGITLGPPGVPNIWWLKAPLTILHYSAFAVGYWALFRLGRSPWLRIDRQQASPHPHSRLNILGAALVFQSLSLPLVRFVVFLSGQQSSSFAISRTEIVIMAIPGLAGTLIGWLALKRIRASGRPHDGLHLAMFSALALPLILSITLAFRLGLSLLIDGRMASTHPMLGALCNLLAPLAIGLAFWMVRATKRWATEEPVAQQRGLLKWIFLAVFLIGMGAVLVTMPSRPTPATILAPVETAPMIQFTFTTVELREEAGARWLAMDYVEQVRGDCQQTFRYDARVPGFTAQTRKDSHLSNAQAGFAPVMHQRILWKLPDGLPQGDALALRDLVAKQWVGKSAAIEPGEERVLFKSLVPDGGTLAAAVGVRLTTDDTSSKGSKKSVMPTKTASGTNLPAGTVGVLGSPRKLEFRTHTYEKDSFRSLSVTTDSDLPAGDCIVGLLQRPDGRTDEHYAHTSVYVRSGQTRVMRHLIWQMSQFGSNRLHEIEGAVQKSFSGRVIELVPGQRVPVFSATNNQGGMVAGFITLRSQTLSVADNPSASISIVDVPQTSTYFLSVRLRVSTPQGYVPVAVGLLGDGSALETHTSILDGGRAGNDWAGTGCYWYFPKDFQAGDLQEIVRQLVETKVTSPNGIKVLPGERVPVFAVTNQSGTIFRGYFELPDLNGMK